VDKVLKKKRTPQFPLTQFITIIVLTISLFLVVDFARRTAVTYRIKGEAVRLEEEVAAVRAERQALEAHLNYVKSDAYVEEIARTQLKWAREGETVVVVLATPEATPAPPADHQAPAPDGAAPQAPWEAWWLVFFNIPPPSL
jgi:cell division protein FtsB